MSQIITLPSAAGAATTLTPVPGGRPNFECVNAYPVNLGLESYVYEENATNEDIYDMTQIQAGQRVEISAVSIHGVCERENNTQNCTAELSLQPAAAISRGDAEVLTEAFVEYSHAWTCNPETDLAWTVANINAMQAGVRLMSAGAGCEAQCTQLWAEIEVGILGEYITNYSPFWKDTIHVDQGFSVIAAEECGRSLFGATTVRIDYKAPDGTEAFVAGDIIDVNRIIAPITAALNDQTGKWWFKLYAVLAGGQILEGTPFFVNVLSKWL